MDERKKENILTLRIKFPIVEQGIKTYVGVPTDYILHKRLHLNDVQVQQIRMAYALYQDTVYQVLCAEVQNIRRRRQLREKNAL